MLGFPDSRFREERSIIGRQFGVSDSTLMSVKLGWPAYMRALAYYMDFKLLMTLSLLTCGEAWRYKLMAFVVSALAGVFLPRGLVSLFSAGSPAIPARLEPGR